MNRKYIAITVIAMALMCHCFVFTSCTSDREYIEPQIPPPLKTGVKASPQEVEDSARLLNKGMKYFEEGNYQPALFEFVRAAELNPQNPEAYLYIAKICARTGRTAQASQSYDIVLKIQPDNIEALREYADFLRVAGENTKAADLYAKLLDLKKGDLQLQLSYASALARSGRYKEAENLYNSAINSDTKDPEPLRAFARYWVEKSDYAGANAAECFQNASIQYEKAAQIAESSGDKWMFKFLQAQAIYRKWLITANSADQKKASVIFDGYENSNEELPWKMSARYYLSVLNEKD